MSAQAPLRSAHVTSTKGPAMRLNARAVALLLIAMAVMLLAIAPLRGFLEARGQLRELQNQATVLERQNQVLQDRIDRLSDSMFLERIARECLGMVKPGETAFVVVPARGAPDPPDC